MTEQRAKTGKTSEPVERRRPARRAIVEAGRRILLRDGMGALNPEAVARESGLSLEIVRAYFCNTDELVLSIASDELSMLARTATDNNDGDENSSDERSILALPKMAESFITARAKSTPETDSKAVSGIMDKDAAAENPETSQPETLPQETPSARRTSGPASEVDGIIKGVAASKQTGGDGIPGLVARLERRVYVIERNLAEEAGSASKAKTEKPASTRPEVEQFAERISVLEKQLAEISEEIETVRTNTSDCVPILEAKPSTELGFTEGVLGSIEPATPSEENIRNDSVKSSDPDMDDTRPLRRKTQAPGLLARAANFDTKTVLTRVAPVPIVLAGLILTTWTAMSAGEDPESAPLDASIAAPETEITLAANRTPLPALSPLEAMMAAADAGDADAQTALGLNYLNGEGVAADTDEALRWLQLASGNGQAVAQYTLATIYADSSSTNSDPFAAKFWFQSAAEQGNRMAMNNLAMFYAQGLGTDQDTMEAAHWFAMAAALGFKVAQFNLAVLYERGEGVPQDNVEAYKWYAIAATQGDEDARARAEFLAQNMDPDVLLALQHEVSTFDPAAMNPDVNDPPQFSSSTG